MQQFIKPYQAQNFPAQFKSKSRWIVWRKETDASGKTTKPPYQVNKPQQHASKTNFSHWVLFAEADRKFPHLVDRGMSGVGYILDSGEVMIDLDHCFNADGTLKPAAQDMVNMCPNAYWEISQSGTGLHGFLLANGKFQTRTRINGIEIYCGDNNQQPCYLTGNRLYGEGVVNLVDCQAELEAVYEKYILPMIPAAPITAPREYVPAENLTVKEIVDKCLHSANSEKFKKLYFADDGYLEDGYLEDYPSRSEADMALIGMIKFWTGPEDLDLFEEVFQSSKLYRPDEKDKGYLERSWNRCITEEFYNWGNDNPQLKLAGLLKSNFNQSEYYEPDDEPTPVTPVAPVTQGIGTDKQGTVIPPPLFMRWADVCKEMKKPTKWCIENYIESGSFCLVNGDSYSGKSMVIASLVKAVAIGGCLGDFQAHQMPVAVMDFENSIRHFGKTLGVLLDTPEEREAIQKYVYRYNRIGRQSAGCDIGSTPEEKRAIIIEMIERINKEHGTQEGMLIIDTMRGVFGLDTRDENDVINTMYPLRGIADRYGWTIMALHHNQKNKQQYSGSMAMIGATTHQFGIEKNPDKRETYLRQEETRDGLNTDLVFVYENDIPLSDYFPADAYPEIKDGKWHRLVFKSTGSEASMIAALDQAQQDCVYICKYLHMNPLANKTSILEAMSKIESVSINKKAPKINRSRAQNALEWGQDAAWINKASAPNNNGFVYANTAMGSAQVTAAGIQKFRMDN